eukprot:TRINITY_DN11754_c0_g1_i1.p1 TRINITY_DN11754_c0_g1~~TRINITY_DN11754_c0_g1_i1.p1  ORF type:complete len:183 (-),score=17.81 TRINITY_DN11754_c0_g1_i1:22-570(-)
MKEGSSDEEDRETAKVLTPTQLEKKEAERFKVKIVLPKIHEAVSCRVPLSKIVDIEGYDEPVYKIESRVTDKTAKQGFTNLVVWRKYADFVWFRGQLENFLYQLDSDNPKESVTLLPALPGETWKTWFGFGKTESSHVENRRIGLNTFMQTISDRKFLTKTKLFRDFITVKRMNRVMQHHTL